MTYLSVSKDEESSLPDLNTDSVFDNLRKSCSKAMNRIHTHFDNSVINRNGGYSCPTLPSKSYESLCGSFRVGLRVG